VHYLSIFSLLLRIVLWNPFDARTNAKAMQINRRYPRPFWISFGKRPSVTTQYAIIAATKTKPQVAREMESMIHPGFRPLKAFHKSTINDVTTEPNPKATASQMRSGQ